MIFTNTTTTTNFVLCELPIIIQSKAHIDGHVPNVDPVQHLRSHPDSDPLAVVSSFVVAFDLMLLTSEHIHYTLMDHSTSSIYIYIYIIIDAN